MNRELGIIIISEHGDVDNLKTTISSIKSTFPIHCQYCVAVKFLCSNEMKQYCDACDVTYYEYESGEELYAKAIETIDCYYISFITEGNIYHRENENSSLSFWDKNKYEKIFIAPIFYKEGQYILNRSLKKIRSVNIEKNPNRIWIALESCVIQKDLFKNVVVELFNEKIEYDFDEILITKIITQNGGYTVLGNISVVMENMLEDSSIAKPKHYDEEWYYECCYNAMKLLEYANDLGWNIKYVQYVVAYILKNCINVNVNSKNKHVLINEKLEKFYVLINQVLGYIDDDIIADTIGNKRVNYFLLKCKYNTVKESVTYREYESNLCVVYKNQFLFNAADTKIKIFLMDMIGDELIITASYPFPFDEKQLTIHAEYNNEIFWAKKNNLYSQYKAFGKPLYENYVFDINIPLKKLNGRNYIFFYLDGMKAHVKLDINFNKALSRLSGAHFAYWNCGKFSINYRKQGLLVMNRYCTRTIKREFLFIASLLRSTNRFARSSGWLRILYHISKPLFSKQIWLFEDKIYKGGDNGEYLYSYVKTKKDGIKKYYVLKKGCLDAIRFQAEHKAYVNFGSIKHKLLFLNSAMVFETHNNVTKQHGFNGAYEKYFRDLFDSQNVCIQHGLTVQSMPDLTNRINDNLKLYFLASKVEKENLMEKPYDYSTHQEILKITGCPRYDGLKDANMRQILITPTWRSYLALPSFKYGESRRYNSEFRNFDYFKIYNSLINNPKLISYARKYNYKIIYLLHPCTSSQISDYDSNENVQLVAATDDLNYEKILTESSLMVTDYSGVQFDFAYMYKPIIYFHPDELPPSYEEGAYKYETMALGEIVKSREVLIDKLCEYMKNDCEIKPEYKKRIDEFFSYHDNNNCERIYQQIMNFKNTRYQK